MAIKKKTTPVLTYGGADITPPPAVQAPTIAGNPTIEQAIAAAQGGQNAANSANATRYGQGLNVLAGGAGSSAGFIQNALDASSAIGRQALNRANENEVNRTAEAQQGAISRGLGNTTIANSLVEKARRTSADERLGIQEAQANRQSQLNLAQAGNAQQNAGNIASFIGNRNDVGPSVGEYAGLVQNAAANAPAPSGQKPVIRIQNGSINDAMPIFHSINTTGGYTAPQTGGYFQGSAVGTPPPAPTVAQAQPYTPTATNQGKTIVTPLADQGSPCTNPNTSKLTKQLLGCKG